LKPIYCYFKFYEDRDHAESFLDGRLWMNPLSTFKEMEHGRHGRADRYEGPHTWIQPLQLGEIQIGDLRIPASELGGPVAVQYDHLDAVNVLCLYAVTPGSFELLTPDNIAAFREHLRVPESSIGLGQHAVLIHKPREFHSRVVVAVKRNGFRLDAGLVEYFDPETFSGPLTNPLFAKRNEFAEQREYRFALDRGVASPESYTLEVGSLRDVCALVDASKINELLRIDVPG
jgi:hypothetical protein